MVICLCFLVLFFFFNDTATTEIYTLSLHDALPIYTKYVPKSYREQGEIDEIRALLKRVERRSAALAESGRAHV